MIKSIANAPPPERRYIRRMAYKAGQPSVIGGVLPTGQFPTAIGSGIFGVEGQDNGIFDGPSFPNSNTGIFYNDYAKDSWEVQQGDLQWQLLRRPGRPLYPGSSAHGIVLIGPSMGTDDPALLEAGARDGEILAEMQARRAAQEAEAARTEQARRETTYKLLGGAALIGAAWLFFSRIKKSAEEM